jgi:uncharacterized membrane protein
VLVIGIGCGLLTALCQAVTYLLSRRYIAAQRRPLQLWVASQLWMSLMALPLLLLWREPTAGWMRTALPLGGALVAYLTAQAFFYKTVRLVPASRVAPLMGIKILFLAGLVLALNLETINAWQWAGIAMAVLAAVAVQRAAQPVPLAGLLGVVATTMAFAVSDVSITDLLRCMDPDKSFSSTMFAMAIIYVLGLGPALVMLPKAGLTKADVMAALPYAIMWLASMVVLFAAINWAGVVLAIILQGLRGPFSILLGYGVAKRGHAHLENPIDRAGLVRQLMAAALMVGATALYVWGRSAT